MFARSFLEGEDVAHVLGIDMGGTKVLSAVIDTADGNVMSSVKMRTRAEHTHGDLVQRTIDSANQAIDESGVKKRDIGAIGIGVAGQIDRAKGIVVSAPNLANMANVPLAKILEKEFDAPVSLFNDVEAAAGGEASFGAGANKPDWVICFVGTGIGGMIYRDHHPYLGTTNTAGEMGHMTVDVYGRICGCGGLGHLEAYSSRTSVVRVILAGLHAGRDSILRKSVDEINPNDPGGSGIRSGMIAKAAEQNDPLVVETLLVAADYLAAGLASIIDFYNPPTIILGGGLIEAVDMFFKAVVHRTRNMALPATRGHIEILRTGLGDNAGIIGAAVLAAQKLKQGAAA